MHNIDEIPAIKVEEHLKIIIVDKKDSANAAPQIIVNRRV